jgi:glycolate oxidase FAD binding subunit
MSALAPRDAADVAAIVNESREPLEVLAGASKRAIGKPLSGVPLDLSALAGIVAYEPAELVLTAHAATPLATIEAALAQSGQRLAFEPPDFGPLLADGAAPATTATLGGTLAVNFGGSRRVVAGAARDHFLGFHAVTGTGEHFKAGGRVVKNVTGYDLPKVLAGSFGTLAVLTEVTIRVAPAPETEWTLCVRCAAPARAVELCSAALGSSYEVSSAAYAPRHGVLLRLEGLEASVAARAAALSAELCAGDCERLEGDASRALWRAVGSAAALAAWPVVWRVSVAPSDAPSVIARLEPDDYVLDWGGGLVTAAFRDVDAERVRASFTSGHALLLKAPVDERRKHAVFQPLPPQVAALAQRVKRAFDPDGKLNPGRME